MLHRIRHGQIVLETSDHIYVRCGDNIIPCAKVGHVRYVKTVLNVRLKIYAQDKGAKHLI